MPKLKTKSRAKKSISLTGTGKMKRYKCGLNHFLHKKRNSRKRNLRKTSCLGTAERHRFKKILNI